MVTSTRVASIKKYFACLKDPRVRNRTKHRLIDIMAIALCGVIANCDTWAEIVDFGKAHAEWLKRFELNRFAVVFLGSGRSISSGDCIGCSGCADLRFRDKWV